MIEARDDIQIAESITMAIYIQPSGKGHTLTEDAKMSLKKRATEMFQQQVTTKAKLAEALGISKATLLRMEQDDPEFAQAMLKAYVLQDGMRNDGVEGAMLQRLLKGEAAPVEYIFYLCNRMPDRWKRKDAQFNNTIINQAGESPARKMVRRWTPAQKELFLKAIAPVESELLSIEEGADAEVSDT